MVRSDADALLVPLLRTLHDCTPSVVPRQQRRQQPAQPPQQQQQQQHVGSSSPALYVPAIVVLLYSQDAAFDRQSFRQARTVPRVLLIVYCMYKYLLCVDVTRHMFFLIYINIYIFVNYFSCSYLVAQMYPCVCVCVCVCVFIKLHITAQSGPVVLAIQCYN